MRDMREQLDIKIEKGIVSELEMMEQFKSEVKMLDSIFQVLDVRLSLLYNHFY